MIQNTKISYFQLGGGDLNRLETKILIDFSTASPEVKPPTRDKSNAD